MCKKAFENSCYGSINEAPDTSEYIYFLSCMKEVLHAIIL